MNRDQFLRFMEENFELDPHTLTGNETVNELEFWDSLAVIKFIALADETFGVTLAGDAVVQAKTMHDLIGLLPVKVVDRAA